MPIVTNDPITTAVTAATSPHVIHLVIHYMIHNRCTQGRRNEFESGAPVQSESGEAPKEIFLVVPLHFLALKAQLVVLVSALVMVSTVQFGQFLLCCSSTHGAPVPGHL